MAGRVSRLLEGRALANITEDLLQAVHTNIADDKLLFTSLVQSIRQMRQKYQQQKVFLGGTKQLLNQPEFRDVERVKNLLGILEEERVVRDLLKAGEDSGLKITIGSENNSPAFRIAAWYRQPTVLTVR